jgi:hypothetical protein
VPLSGTPHGRALAEQEVQVVAEAGSPRLLAPVTSRGEALAGVRDGRATLNSDLPFAACGGTLREDATILCLDWHGGAPRLRQASEGAGR